MQDSTPKGLPPVVFLGAVGLLLSLVIGLLGGTTAFLLSLMGLGLVALIAMAVTRRRAEGTRPLYCPHCGATGAPKRVTKGSTGLELLLWLLFLLPGLIYSVWRLASRYDACPSCLQAGMIPTDSPKARGVTSG